MNGLKKRQNKLSKIVFKLVNKFNMTITEAATRLHVGSIVDGNVTKKHINQLKKSYKKIKKENGNS